MSLKDGRCVARPLQNLGSTCFVNCVLQALAHAPELCMAVDAQPHSSVCPIAAENAATSSLALSIPAKVNGKRAGAPSSNSSASSGASDDDPAIGSRRSSRGKSKGSAAAPGGRKSPSSDQDSNRSSSNSRQRKYCVLCELESHFKAVHDLNRRDKALAPSTFVNGFFEHVAPWFKLGVQEDAHEFLRLLIDAMQKSCQQARLQDNPQDDAGAGAFTGNTNDDDNNNSAAPPVPSISISSGTVSKDDKEYPFSLFRGMVESVRHVTLLCSDVELYASISHTSPFDALVQTPESHLRRLPSIKLNSGSH
jgi:Ubiquitin carboxyl-terminal hydrolase